MEDTIAGKSDDVAEAKNEKFKRGESLDIDYNKSFPICRNSIVWQIGILLLQFFSTYDIIYEEYSFLNFDLLDEGFQMIT